MVSAATFGLELRISHDLSKEVTDQIGLLDAARSAKDYAGADTIRAELEANGWIVETGKTGTTVRLGQAHESDTALPITPRQPS